MTKFDRSPLSRATQDYLKAIFALQSSCGNACTNDLCARLGHLKPASVTEMCKRLAQLGLVDYTPYNGVHLTPQGEQQARKVIRAHRLLELYLVQVMGFTADRVHPEAEAMEHAISDEFLTRLETILGHPSVGVHGEPSHN
ncbi:MAG: metal-dependent transcriptional regulator [Anaerolineae bacterium]|nr:metal-dependent transcriptional regulator [Anaerolineae bacterium]